MSDGALEAFTRFVNSPPGQLAAGGVLFGVVFKFFERVEAVLTDQTKLEIALWLVGVKTEERVKPWAEMFATMFDRVFGKKHLSWRCFGRSCVASLCAVAITALITTGKQHDPTLAGTLFWASLPVTINLLPDYISLLQSRLCLNRLQDRPSPSTWSIVLLANVAITTALALLCALPWAYFTSWAFHLWAAAAMGHGVVSLTDEKLTDAIGMFPSVATDPSQAVFFYPPFFTSIWLWLYAGSGFLLKAARRFDMGFDWFNRRFDIERKPLQSIGLVAGALVAIVYWAAVVIVGW